MDQQTLKIQLGFSGKLTQEQHDKVVDAVMDALIHATDTAGLVPDDAEEFTTWIAVVDIRSDRMKRFDVKAQKFV